MGTFIFFEKVNLILPILTFLALCTYAYFTYMIAKDIYEPFVSFKFEKRDSGDYNSLNFYLINNSKVEVEVFGKLSCKIKGEIFESNQGFYNDKHSLILQPFSEFKGWLDLESLVNKKGIELHKLILKEVVSMEFTFQIKYRKTGIIKKWKKSHSYRHVYDFKSNHFYLKD